MRKLPVFRSVGEVFAGVTRHYFQLLFIAWPAALIVLAILGVIEWMKFSTGYHAAVGMDGDADFFAFLISAYPGRGAFALTAIYLLGMGAMAIAAVRWHRFVILGEGVAPGAARVLRKEDGSYIWTAIKITLIGLASVILFAASAFVYQRAEGLGPQLYLFVPVLAAAWLWAISAYLRISLALPDAALGNGGRLGYVFDESAGNVLRLMAFALLLIIVMAIVAGVLAIIEEALGMPVAEPDALAAWIVRGVLVIVSIAFNLYLMMLQVTMLSVAYREIIGLPGGHEGEATVAEPTPAL